MPTHRIVAAACPLDSRQKSTNQFLTPALGPVSETRAAELASRHLRRTMASAPLEAEEADFEILLDDMRANAKRKAKAKKAAKKAKRYGAYSR